MLKLGRVTKVKVFFLVLVYVFNIDLFEFSAAILEKSLLHWVECNLGWNHTRDLKIKRARSASSIWNHKYNIRPKLHDPKFNYPIIRSIFNFTITAEIHARSLANFYCQYAVRDMNLKFMRRVSER